MTPLSPRAKLDRLADAARQRTVGQPTVWAAAVILAGLSADRVAGLAGAELDAVQQAAARATTDPAVSLAAGRLWLETLATPIQLTALRLLAERPCAIGAETAADRHTVTGRTVSALERRGLAQRTTKGKAEITDLGAAIMAAGLAEPPEPEHPHGTHACYAFDQCRCLPCRVVGSGYERRRSRQQQNGHPRTVPADPVRRHVRSLMSVGVGLKQIAKVAGVGQATLAKLLYGTPSQGRPPSRRVRRSTAAALLAVEREELAAGARVDAGPTLALVDEMLAGGWTKAAIGRAVHGPKATSLEIARGTGGRVTVATARKIVRLHAAWMAGRVLPDAPTLGVVPSREDQADHTSRCVDCGGDAMPGGALRCLGCFQIWCRHRRAS